MGKEEVEREETQMMKRKNEVQIEREEQARRNGWMKSREAMDAVPSGDYLGLLSGVRERRVWHNKRETQIVTKSLKEGDEWRQTKIEGKEKSHEPNSDWVIWLERTLLPFRNNIYVCCAVSAGRLELAFFWWDKQTGSNPPPFSEEEEKRNTRICVFSSLPCGPAALKCSLQLCSMRSQIHEMYFRSQI